jgi:hypothetical protein
MGGGGRHWPEAYVPGEWRVHYKPPPPRRLELLAAYPVSRDALAAVLAVRNHQQRVVEPVDADITGGPQPPDAQLAAWCQARELEFSGEVFAFKRCQITDALLHDADRGYVPVVRQVFHGPSVFVVDMKKVSNTIARERKRSVLRDAFRDALALRVATACVQPVAWDIANECFIPSNDLNASTHTGHWAISCTVRLLLE